jgi:transcriptional regulator with XRE-family HTH domain
MPHPIHDRRYQFVAKLLADTRKEQGLLQEDVADRLGRTQAYLSKCETGLRRIDLIELLDILRALNVEPHAFMDKVLAQVAMTLPR